MYITITARLLNPNIYIISRAGHLRYAEALRGAGANEVFIPEYEGGLIVWRSIERLVGPTGRNAGLWPAGMQALPLLKGQPWR